MAERHGLDMLLSQYHNSTNLRAYIKIFLDEFAEVKKAQEDSIKYRYLADSFGMMVDDVAYLVGTSRIIFGASALGYFGFYKNPQAYPAGDDNKPGFGGTLKSDLDRDSGDFIRTDAQLKDAIKARIIKIMGSCTIEQILVYIDLVLNRSLDVKLEEGGTFVQFSVNETLSIQDKVLLAYMLPNFKPVGKRFQLKDLAGTIELVYASQVFPR